MFLKQSTRSGQPTPTPIENVPPNLKTPSIDGPAQGPTASVVPAYEPSHLAEDGGKRLIVGDGIRLKGEITACDRLVVEGHVEVTLNETRMLEIKPSGRFIGSCEVEEAQISGIYEGDLTVRGRLIVHASGKVTGKIHYGELELERGGRIAGELTVRERDGAAIKSKPPFQGKNAA